MQRDNSCLSLKCEIPQDDVEFRDDSSLDIDNKRLADTGYTPDLNRDFSILSILAVGFSVTNSWFGISASLVTGIYSGGTVVTIYGTCFITLISTCVAISLSEMASAMPNAGGQYFWASELAPRKWSSFLAYMTGGIAWAGAVFTTASATLSVASALVGVYQISNPAFVPNFLELNGRLSVFAAYELINIFTGLFNCYGKILPVMAKVTLSISLISMTVITITVLAISNPKNSAEFVFATFRNESGWSSPFIAFMVGLINPNWSFACLDSVTHLAEEVPKPERAIPYAILGTVGIGFVTSLVYSISIFFAIKDIDGVYLSPTGVPLLEIFKQALESTAGAVALESLIICTGVGCLIACHTWQARLAWSFSRDRGLPGSKHWAVVNKELDAPVNAHLLNCVLVAILGCLYLASSTAFNSMITACIVLLYISYSIPIALLLFAKKRSNLKHGPFWTGILGLISNYVVLIWTVFTLVLYSFPYYYPVVAGNMNYVSAVYFLVFSFLVVYWFIRGRKTFRSKEERDKLAASGVLYRVPSHSRGKTSRE
ncbi:hypothetical protein TWF730_004879 [Orbilia blumenaviensis]|uniref:Choline transport protein n=1 Tax=Orbilia blumenaviensis TaxID=1796055 RepID=A0AAV9VGK6_9PEZI